MINNYLFLFNVIYIIHPPSGQSSLFLTSSVLFTLVFLLFIYLASIKLQKHKTLKQNTCIITAIVSLFYVALPLEDT